MTMILKIRKKAVRCDRKQLSKQNGEKLLRHQWGQGKRSLEMRMVSVEGDGFAGQTEAQRAWALLYTVSAEERGGAGWRRLVQDTKTSRGDGKAVRVHWQIGLAQIREKRLAWREGGGEGEGSVPPRSCFSSASPSVWTTVPLSILSRNGSACRN